jgi:hypothetical protein
MPYESSPDETSTLARRTEDGSGSVEVQLPSSVSSSFREACTLTVAIVLTIAIEGLLGWAL